MMAMRKTKVRTNKPKIGIVMDPVADIIPHKDTTLALMRQLRDKGADLYYMTVEDLYLKDDKAWGLVQPVTVFDDNKNWFSLEGEQAPMALGALDIILMRKDPPVDKRFIHACYMLEQARRNGAAVYNDPTAMILWNEKLLSLEFPDFCPPTVVSASYPVLREFLTAQKQIILKPLDTMGGEGVFMIDQADVNFDVIWEMHTSKGTYPVMAQKFLPEIAQGDARVFVFDGEVFDQALVRVPKAGSVRGNLAAGGSYDVRPLTDREQEIAEAVGAELMREGVTFAGLDIIGDYLIEVNITSPTGLLEVSKACGVDLPALVVENMWRDMGWLSEASAA